MTGQVRDVYMEYPIYMPTWTCYVHVLTVFSLQASEFSVVEAIKLYPYAKLFLLTALHNGYLGLLRGLSMAMGLSH